ncbi:helix-turn-helix domain-containing protein [Nocardia sp. NPDC127526]|uniref:helix-turn-helix domain-containing protein n=1 Tax=Nocardia sp. NPDC127526 TaxID=3345393 RepID=UPI0036322020
MSRFHSAVYATPDRAAAIADPAGSARWRGDVLLRPGVLAFSGSIGATGRHAHHAVQVMISTSPVAVAGDHAEYSGTHMIIPADAPHRILLGAATGIAVFLDPDSIAGRAAAHRAHGAGWSGGPQLPLPDHDAPLAATVAELMTALAPGAADPGADRHPAVVAALECLPAAVAAGTINTTELAARVGISASRLTHLFTAQVGLPLRRYVLWLRLVIARNAVADGAGLTTAAHAAGFADSAHLTRTCREIFGLPPSALSRNLAWHNDSR